MTTPRDDIAGLSERLRDALVDQPNYGKCLRMSLSYEDVEGAATQLDALSARVKELEAQPTKTELETRMAIGVEKLLLAKLGRKWTPAGISIVSLIDELAARAIRAEQERDEAYERVAIYIEQREGHIPDWRGFVAELRSLASGPEKEKI